METTHIDHKLFERYIGMPYYTCQEYNSTNERNEDIYPVVDIKSPRLTVVAIEPYDLMRHRPMDMDMSDGDGPTMRPATTDTPDCLVYIDDIINTSDAMLDRIAADMGCEWLFEKMELDAHRLESEVL